MRWYAEIKTEWGPTLMIPVIEGEIPFFQGRMIEAIEKWLGRNGNERGVN
jgi:hypothetical protein